MKALGAEVWPDSLIVEDPMTRLADVSREMGVPETMSGGLPGRT